MTNVAPEVSVVIPLFNEEDNVAPLATAMSAMLDRWGRPCEVVLVDDGSTDATPARIDALTATDPRFRSCRLSRNAGQTQALTAGFQMARGSIIVTMDGDLQNDPADIPRLVERIDQGSDVVCGWRKRRRDPMLLRKIPSSIANRIIRGMTAVPIHDTGCTLRAYRSEVVRALSMYSDMHRFIPALTSMTGARVEEVVVAHRPRQFGTSKYGIGRTFKVLADVVTISMLVRSGSTPGRWFSRLAVVPGVLGVACAALALVPSPESQNAVVLWSLTVLMVYLASQMITLAILAEMFTFCSDRSSLRRLHRALLAVASTGAERIRGARE